AFVGQGNLPPALRHRNQLPADASGADKDQHAGPAVAAVVRGRGVDPAQRVGVAALGGAVPVASGRSAGGPGAAGLPRHAPVAATLRRSMARRERRSPYATPHPQMTYDIHCQAKKLESTEAAGGGATEECAARLFKDRAYVRIQRPAVSTCGRGYLE